MCYVTATLCAQNIRPLGIALANELGRCKPGRDYERLALLSRLYTTFLPADQLQCRAELLDMHDARLSRIAAVEASSNG